MNLRRALLLIYFSLGASTACRAPTEEFLPSAAPLTPRGAIPQPLGTHVQGWTGSQTAAADADHFVIYLNEWIDDTDGLGPFGRRHWESLLRRVESSSASIVVETSDDAELDEQRRAALIALLAERGVDDGESRVQVGRGAAEGLHGVEAARLERGYYFSGARGGGGGAAGGGGMGGGNAGGLGGSSGGGGGGLGGGGGFGGGGLQ